METKNMNLTIAILNRIGFIEVINQEHRTFERKADSVILYEWQEPIWLVQLDGIIGQYTNLMRIISEEDLTNAIKGRNIK
jgi:hypothetical protein